MIPLGEEVREIRWGCMKGKVMLSKCQTEALGNATFSKSCQTCQPCQTISSGWALFNGEPVHAHFLIMSQAAIWQFFSSELFNQIIFINKVKCLFGTWRHLAL